MMNAKRIVKIELRDPQLRRVRKGLRDIIKLAVNQKLRELYSKQHEYFNKYLKSNDHVLKENLKWKWGNFRRQSERLDKLLSSSIIICGSGAGCASLDEAIQKGLDPQDRPTDLDMVWMPSHKKWYCTKCYEVLI
jgi:hypothetical protein